jgi:membrane-associated phospholipid phosphatase
VIRPGRRPLQLLALLCAVSGPGPGGPVAPLPAAAEPLSWDPAWRRFDLASAALVGGMLAVGGLSLLAEPEPGSAWRSAILADDAVRDRLVAGTRDRRQTAAYTSDVLVAGLVSYPLLVDALGVSLWAQRSAQVAGQLALLSMQSLVVSQMLNFATKQLVPRERPLARGCVADPRYSPECGTGSERRSFYSGHTAMAFTGAGLLCAFHGALPLYGRPWDHVACAGGLVLATSVGALRIVSDRHYLSDVVTGGLLGFASGFLLPRTLHLRGGRGVTGDRTVLLPGAPAPLGLSWAGRF